MGRRVSPEPPPSVVAGNAFPCQIQFGPKETGKYQLPERVWLNEYSPGSVEYDLRGWYMRQAGNILIVLSEQVRENNTIDTITILLTDIQEALFNPKSFNNVACHHDPGDMFSDLAF